MQSLQTSDAVFAEPDKDRLRKRLAAVTEDDLNDHEVAQLAGGNLDLIRQLDVPGQRAVMDLIEDPTVLGQVERMVGGKLDYVPVAFLDRARAASRSVVRIIDGDRRELGSGVMISPRLLLTNNHVIASEAEARDRIVQFDYELSAERDEVESTDFRLDPTTLFVTSPRQALDSTIVALGAKVAGPRNDADLGYCPLSSSGDKHAALDFVTIVQHPNGDYKQIALRENRVIGRGNGGTTLHYGADTLPGSSGSPVFNDQFELVALHHAGGPLNETTLEGGGPVPVESNEGIRISAIVAHVRTVAAALPPSRRNLIVAAIDPGFRGPSLLATRTEGGAGATPVGATPLAASSPGAAGVGAGSTLATGQVTAPSVVSTDDGWQRIRVPVEVAVRVPASVVLTSEEPGDAYGRGRLPAGLERNDAPEPTYERRLGYEPGFLGIDVPVPTLAQALTDNVAIPTGEGADGVDPVLRYHHFSVVQNGVRRMPFFTAVNIDGARSRDIDRDTGEVGEIEAAETWYEDPRVAGAQLTQAFFRENPGLFDRGHLVRRLDPAWGSKPVAKRAADDTFHFTNCCPQVGIGFNRSGKAWLGIETYVLDAARTADVRISVFSGPVFAAGDPPVGGINVPQAFWKIVARIDPTGTLRATGFIASQAHLVDKALGGPEAVRSWEDLGPIKVHQRRIDAIEAASELSFGDLRNHDTAPTVESVAQLTDVADAVW